MNEKADAKKNSGPAATAAALRARFRENMERSKVMRAVHYNARLKHGFDPIEFCIEAMQTPDSKRPGHMLLAYPSMPEEIGKL